MRVVATVASCLGVSFVLHGCGSSDCVFKDDDDCGGGGEYGPTTHSENSTKASSCLAGKMDVVSQTFSGVTEVSMDATMKTGSGMKGGFTASFTEMFDFEKFNVREDISGSVEALGTTMPMNTTQILNLAEKQLIVYISQDDMAGKNFKACTIHQLPPETPTPEMLSQIFQSEVKPTLQSAAVCGGNDGTYDTWKFSEAFDGKLPPIQDGQWRPSDSHNDSMMIKDGLFSEEVQMTEDALLHSSVTSVHGDILDGKTVLGNLVMQASLNVTDVKGVGPSASDLDPSQFDVECKPANTTVDLEAFLQTKPAGFARWQLLRIMKASKQSEDLLMV